MNGKQLKNSILQWAIQGKLVPQDPNDEPASVLLERIRAEKARMVKDGKIKKDKNESIIFRGEDNSHYEKFPDGTVKCIDEAIPFEVPQGWEWARVSTIFQLNPKNHADDNDPAGFIPMERIDATYLSSFSFAVKKWKEIKNGFTHFADGDVAVAKITPCFQNRKSMILQGLPNGIGAGTTELKVLRSYSDTISKEYLLFFLESPYFVEEASFKGTANQQRIISGYLENKLFPIPPRKEQDRIVAVIKSSFFVADRYDIAQKKLDHLNSSLNPLLKKSILQEAIQGKLVLQDPNDEPAAVLLERIQAKKLKLLKDGFLRKKDIVDSVIFKGDDNKYYEKVGGKDTEIGEELPFDIPSSWAWCRLGYVIVLQSGQDLTPDRYFSSPTGIPYITGASNISNGAVLVNRWTNSPTSISHKGDLLITCKGTVGTMAYNTIGDIHIARQIMSIHSDWILIDYIELYLKYSLPTLEKAAHSIIPGISRETVLSTLIPIPPLEEQHRIVDRIDDIYQNLQD